MACNIMPNWLSCPRCRQDRQGTWTSSSMPERGVRLHLRQRDREAQRKTGAGTWAA
jgi:hypothetical protein